MICVHLVSPNIFINWLNKVRTFSGLKVPITKNRFTLVQRLKIAGALLAKIYTMIQAYGLQPCIRKIGNVCNTIAQTVLARRVWVKPLKKIIVLFDPTAPCAGLKIPHLAYLMKTMNVSPLLAFAKMYQKM